MAPMRSLASVASFVVALLPLAPRLPAQDKPPVPAFTPQLAEVAAAYVAKITASAIFVSGRTLESVLAEELAPDGAIEQLVRPLLTFAVDRDQRTVTVRLGMMKATAAATGNLGCTLVRGDASLAALQQRAAATVAASSADPATVDWPLGERLPPEPPEGVDQKALAEAIDAAFAESMPGKLRRTHAVVVVHRGRLIGERYADGYTKDMLLPGWSMTKTIVNALVGIRVRQGKLDLDAELPVPEWTTAEDSRRALRLPDLLTMTSGLRWREDYDDPTSDALRMLFLSSDHAAVQASQPLEAPIGERFYYSSGSTNLVCRVLRTTFASDKDYWAFPTVELFLPLGMQRAIVETDPSGTFVGSSYGFATARDWARFGMLYAQDGVFAGERILPEGWIARSAQPAKGSDGRHGWHIWCNADPDGDGPKQRPWPELPQDLLRMDGHHGQYVVVLPADQLVIVRLGCTKQGGVDIRALVRGVRRACGP